MSANAQNNTILTLDIRLQKFGYAVLNGPRELLAWGIKTYRAAEDDERVRLARKRIVPLLAMYQPSVVVANHVSGLNVSRAPKHRQIVKLIEAEAKRHSGELVLLGRNEIRRVFSALGDAGKDAIASQIALLFPELTWKLPPVRKTWMSEHHNTTIFDAVALGLTHLTQFAEVFSEHKQQGIP
ncbi:MAG: hypothetical protein DMG65_19620 [Candidatus Angelobacter sp. Gp1-AA117]|nr:MAG: hypothetical protein DMG65_19620 [Candidatus Angelobacter sp. Gp1-AA117]